MGFYRLLNPHSFSFDFYAVKAYSDMYYWSTTITTSLYFVLLYKRKENMRSHLFRGNEVQFIYVNENICTHHPRIAQAQSLISELTKKKKLTCEPTLLIKESGKVSIDSCKVGLLAPPIIMISSAAINGLTVTELRWLIATEISRLYRRTSTLAHKNKSMFIGRTLRLFFILPFKGFAKSADVAHTTSLDKGISPKIKAFTGFFGMLIIMFWPVVNGLTTLTMLGLINTLFILFLCRRWPDKRFAHKDLKNQAIQKAERKTLIKKMKGLLKAKEDFADSEIVDAPRTTYNAYFKRDIFNLKSNVKSYQQKRNGLSLFYRVRRSFALLIGLCAAYVIFSYPLYDFYKASFPEETLKKYDYMFNIMTWNPKHDMSFNYGGAKGTILFDIANEHDANITIKLKDKVYKGIARMIVAKTSRLNGVRQTDRMLPVKVSIIFTRLDEDNGLSKREEEKLETAITRRINSQFKGKVFEAGTREGIRIYYTYRHRPLLKLYPISPNDALFLFNSATQIVKH